MFFTDNEQATARFVAVSVFHTLHVPSTCVDALIISTLAEPESCIPPNDDREDALVSIFHDFNVVSADLDPS